MGATILVVEDNRDNKELMQYLLNAFGYAPLLAAGGAEGIRLAQEHRPDLILMDLQMPEMDGYEATAEIRKAAGIDGCTIVAVTAFAMVGDQQRILSSGFDGYISKPIAPDTFVTQVESFLSPDLRAGATPAISAHMSSILVLDDRSDDRELLATLLGHAGYSVRGASTGEEALGQVRTERPDLVITDILMPGMNGYEFVRRLRTDPETDGLPVVFCTAHYEEGEVRHLAAACGVTQFIPKPCDPDTVVRTVAQALGTPPTRPRPLASEEFADQELRLLNDKLVQKVGELESANGERRKLLGQLLTAHEEERERIAGDLHDDSIQAMVALRMRLETLAARTKQPKLAGELNELKDDAGMAVGRLRRLLFELQPMELDRSGVGVALEVYLEQARDEDGLAFTLEDRTTRRPTEAIRTLLYRVAREALANVRKHAKASHVEVDMDDDENGFSLKVRDDGEGFDPEQGLRVRAGHLGLPAMRERVEIAGGRLKVESGPAKGSAIEVWLPDFEFSDAIRPKLRS
jgi:CheY-like chemotaxis protein